MNLGQSQMENTRWFRQTKDKPLFPDMLWNKPENKLHAGKLLIMGGNSHGFSTVAESYNEAQKAGVGSTKIILPDYLQKTVGRFLEDANFAPSTKSGGFAKTALTEWLSFADWSDGVLIAGDLGKNSETEIALESFLTHHHGLLVVGSDVIDNFGVKDYLLDRPSTTIVINFNALQKTASYNGIVLKHTMATEQVAKNLLEFYKKYPVNIVTILDNQIFISSEQQVSVTPIETKGDWPIKIMAHGAVWWLQHPNQTFKALTTSIITG